MTPRVSNPHAKAPAAIQAMMALEKAVAGSGLEPELIELVRMRASQINGCGFCIALHALTARKLGIDEMRLHMLPAWRESRLYSERERAALAWTETLTRVSETGALDADYAKIEAVFTEPERVHLTLAIGAINTWNRLNIGLHGADESDAEELAERLAA